MSDVLHLYDEDGAHVKEFYSESMYELGQNGAPGAIVHGSRVFVLEKTTASPSGFWSHTYREIKGKIYHTCPDRCVRPGVVNPRVAELVNEIRREDA